jgi:hypothetical protein
MSDREPVNPSGPDPASPPESGWRTALLRLWCLRPMGAAPAASPVPAILSQGVLWLALWLAIDRAEREPRPRLTAEGVPLLAWYVLGVLGLAALLRWRARAPAGFAQVLAVAAAVVPAVLLLVTWARDYLSFRDYLFAAVAVGIYAAVLLARGLRGVTGRSQRGAAVAGVLFIALFVWASDRLDAIPDLWNPEDSAGTDADLGNEAPDAEALLFGQIDRIDEALAAMRRPATVGAQGYFLGFAGVGGQKVFAEEIGLAKRVLGERFDLADRSIALINDQRDLESAPLATVSGLRYALRGIAMRMNPDRDVLFLAISSHGSEDGTIDVENDRLPLDALGTDDLDDALRESGIKWRVIIISACYAGAFLEPLRNPQTIVITAAAADRSSFGCSNDRDLTYFGEAFYRDALPGARSLRDAFDRAAAAIAARERRERITPSEPQAFFGAEIEAKLAAMQAAPGGPAHITVVRAPR